MLNAAVRVFGLSWVCRTVAQNVAVGCFIDRTIDLAWKSEGLEDKVKFKSGKYPQHGKEDTLSVGIWIKNCLLLVRLILSNTVQGPQILDVFMVSHGNSGYPRQVLHANKSFWLSSCRGCRKLNSVYASIMLCIQSCVYKYREQISVQSLSQAFGALLKIEHVHEIFIVFNTWVTG